MITKLNNACETLQNIAIITKVLKIEFDLQFKIYLQLLISV